MDHQYDEKKSDVLCKILTSSNNTVKKKNIKINVQRSIQVPSGPVKMIHS